MTTDEFGIMLLVGTVGVWGYLITLGRMASTLHRSVIVWVGGTFIPNMFGFIGSSILMNSRSRLDDHYWLSDSQKKKAFV